MSVSASMSQRLAVLSLTGDGADDSIALGRTAGGELLVDGGATKVRGGKATVSNTGSVVIQSGAGADQVVLDTSAGALPRCDVFGGSGLDTLLLVGASASENVEISASGSQAVIVGGSSAGPVTQANLDSIETVAFRPGAGGDNVLVADLSGSGVQRVGIDLATDGAIDVIDLAGTAASDTVRLAVSGGLAVATGLAVQFAAIGVEATDRFVLRGGAGDDLLNADAVAGRVDLSGDAGNDTLLGAGGGDVLQGGDGNDEARGNAGADLVSLGDGDDRVLWCTGDGSDTVQGGGGSDLLRATGTNGADSFTLAADADGVSLFHAGSGAVMAISGTETLHITPGAGADTIDIGALVGTGVLRIEIDLGSDGAADVVRAALLPGLELVVTGLDAADQLLIG